MGQIKYPASVKLFAAIMFSDEDLLAPLREKLEREWGDMDLASPIFVFDKTDYYEPEMGRGLKKAFFSFSRLISPEAIADIKCRSNQIESEYVAEVGGKPGRRLNIDPGYVSPANVVLATTKDYSHRIYLGRGIFAEVTLEYRHGEFVPFPWTYPDYKENSYLKYLGEVRNILLGQTRERA